MPEAIININTIGDNTIIPADADFRYDITTMFFVVSGSVSVMFKSGATMLTGAMPFLATGQFVLDDFSFDSIVKCGIGEAFIINLSSAIQVGGRLSYVKKRKQP